MNINITKEYSCLKTNISHRVRSVKGLRVIDASIMPLVTTGNTNAPAIMIGEKAADMIKEEWGAPVMPTGY